MVRQTRADSSDGSSDETGNSSDTERYYPKPFGDQPTNWSGRPAVWDSKTGKWLDVRPTESEALAASRVAAASGSDVISVSQAGVRVATVVLGKPGTSYGESEGWIRVCFRPRGPKYPRLPGKITLHPRQRRPTDATF